MLILHLKTLTRYLRLSTLLCKFRTKISAACDMYNCRICPRKLSRLYNKWVDHNDEFCISKR